MREFDKHCSPPDTAISVKDGNFQYGPDDPNPVLKEINIEIKRGQLVAVVGTVGTGKSTLLGALLGDVFKKSGSVTVSVSNFLTSTWWAQLRRVVDGLKIRRLEC